MHLVVVHHDGAVVQQTSAETSDHEIHTVEVGDPATGVEVLDRQLTDHEQAEGNSHLRPGGVVSVVEVRPVCWSVHGVKALASGEPRFQLESQDKL